MSTPEMPSADVLPNSDPGSIAHSIVGEFVSELAKKEGFAEIAKALEAVVYDSPSEASLRAVLFGDEAI